MNSKLNEKNHMSLITYKINNTNMKIFARRRCWKIFLKAIFSHSGLLQSFCTKFSPSCYVISLVRKFPFVFEPIIIQNTMCNLQWYYTFCTKFTLELHCSQPMRIKFFFFSCMLCETVFQWKAVEYHCIGQLCPN